MSNSEQKGFTIIELLVIIGVISLLMSIFLSVMSVARANARDSRRLADFKTLTSALELFYAQYNMYPCGSLNTLTPGIQTDGDWLHAHTPSDSFLNSVPVGSLTCPAYPTFGLVTAGLVPYGIKDPANGTSTYVYEVTNDRQKYILYTILEYPSNASKMTGDGGFENCFYEVGNGVGQIDPFWLCQ